MSRWYRAYTGTVTDEKLAEAALIAEVSRSVAIATWHCLLESAATVNNCGGYATTARRVAAILCEPLAQITALFAAFDEVGLSEAGSICAWKKRQYQSDSSTDRVKQYRAARKDRGLLAQWQPSKAFRQEVYDRDGGACVYCGSVDDLTLDHKTPEMHGGDNSTDNLQTACRRCNAQKRDLTHEEYTARLAGNGHVTLQQRPQRTETKTEECNSNELLPHQPEIDLKPEHVVEAWNDMAGRTGLPVIRKLTQERRTKLNQRIRQNTIDEFTEAIGAIERSPFLRGDNGRSWRANFDFLLSPTKFTRLIEGTYDR